MTEVKICGLRDAATALATAEAGADYIGLVLAPSSRQVTAEQARAIVTELKKLAKPPQTVGVVVNLPAAKVNRLAAEIGLDCVQLSGDESWEYCRDIAPEIIKTVHISEGKAAADIIYEIERGQKLSGSREIVPLLDTKIGAAYGGTGTSFDWELAAAVAARHNIIVAGGLAPENVTALLQKASPWGVDVSSGVETNGAKDVAKIRNFIETVREQDAA